jgi:hypothetical protein
MGIPRSARIVKVGAIAIGDAPVARRVPLLQLDLPGFIIQSRRDSARLDSMERKRLFVKDSLLWELSCDPSVVPDSHGDDRTRPPPAPECLGVSVKRRDADPKCKS